MKAPSEEIRDKSTEGA